LEHFLDGGRVRGGAAVFIILSPERTAEDLRSGKLRISCKRIARFFEAIADDLIALLTAFLASSTLLLWWAIWRRGVRESKETVILHRADVSVEPLDFILETINEARISPPRTGGAAGHYLGCYL
jgi:hypothetical protein